MQLLAIIEWLGAGLTWVTFSGEIFFFFEGARVFACAFKFRSKTFPCILFFLAVLHFVSEKTQGQNIEVCTMNATRRNKRKPFLNFQRLS